jgi:SAM-dependent methyltransferase
MDVSVARHARDSLKPFPSDRSLADTEAPLWRLQSDAVNERLLRRWLPTGLGSVLKTDLYDESVSPGLYPILRAHAERVAGIDVSPRVATTAARRHPQLDASVADVRALPFPADSFDAILSNSTLDHFGDRSQVVGALTELSRVLRPGGHLVITLDNPLNPLLAVRNHLPRGLARMARQGFPYEPGWTCGPRRLRGLLAGRGLVVRAETAILHAPRAALALLGRRSGPAQGLLRLALMAEAIEGLPTRYLTGHFIAVYAVLPSKLGPSPESIDGE